MKMNPVVHFEMPAKNKKRVAEFYTKAFGWQMQQLGAEMGNYILATTTTTVDKKTQRPKTPGAINGGFLNTMLKILVYNNPPSLLRLMTSKRR